MKRLFLLIGLLIALPILFLLAISSTAQEGVPVKSLNGAGPPNANMAHVVGTEYIDISASPPVLYVCTAVTLTPILSQCSWTQGGCGGSNPLGGDIYVGPPCPAGKT